MRCAAAEGLLQHTLSLHLCRLVRARGFRQSLKSLDCRRHSCVCRLLSAVLLSSLNRGCAQAYVDMFSRSLALEYPFLSIQNQAPAYVATKMSKIRKCAYCLG